MRRHAGASPCSASLVGRGHLIGCCGPVVHALLTCPHSLQARSQAVVSALGLCCNAISDKNATALGEAVRACPPENTTALSTALAQAAAVEETCPTVASVCCWGSLPACSHCGAMRTSCGVGMLWYSLIRLVATCCCCCACCFPPCRLLALPQPLASTPQSMQRQLQLPTLSVVRRPR